MPPKKKKGKGKKKKKKDGEKTELTVEEKYKKTMEEIEVLKDELSSRTEISRRSRDQSDTMKERMMAAKDEVEKEQQSKLDISSDLTRQYKTMQSEMALRIHILEQTVAKLRDELAKTQAELKRTQKERDDMRKEKDEIIANLQLKIELLESSYESILHAALDSMSQKLEDAQKRWVTESSDLQQRNKELLLEFGLNPLEI